MNSKTITTVQNSQFSETLQRSRVFMTSVEIKAQDLTGDSRDEAEGSQHSEGSQCLHVKPSTFLQRHACYHIDGIHCKREETVGKDQTSRSSHHYRKTCIQSSHTTTGIEHSVLQRCNIQD